MRRAKGDHLSPLEGAELEDGFRANVRTAVLARRFNLSERSVQVRRAAFSGEKATAAFDSNEAGHVALAICYCAGCIEERTGNTGFCPQHQARPHVASMIDPQLCMRGR